MVVAADWSAMASGLNSIIISSKSASVLRMPVNLSPIHEPKEEYYLAESVLEALSVLSTRGGGARLVLGGTDLFLDTQQGRDQPVHTLVDVTNIPKMGLFEIRKQYLFIGVEVLLSQIERSPLVRKHRGWLKSIKMSF